MTICPKCGATIDGKCRECRNAYARNWRRAAYQRNPEKWLSANREWRAQNPEQWRESSAKWPAARPEATRVMQAARNALQYAVRCGRLTRPESCEECGAACKPEGAHHDYTRPLDVRWLCQSCHRRWDRAEPKSKGVAA